MQDQNPFSPPEQSSSSLPPSTMEPPQVLELEQPITLSGRLTRKDLKKLNRTLSFPIILWVFVLGYIVIQGSKANDVFSFFSGISYGGYTLVIATYLVTKSAFTARRLQIETEANGTGGFGTTQFEITNNEVAHA